MTPEKGSHGDTETRRTEAHAGSVAALRAARLSEWPKKMSPANSADSFLPAIHSTGSRPEAVDANRRQLCASVPLWRFFAGSAHVSATNVNHGAHGAHGELLSKCKEAAYRHLPLEKGVSVISVPSVVAFRLQREISL